MYQGPEGQQSAFSEVKELFKDSPLPILSPKLVSDQIILQELVHLQENDPTRYKTLSLDNSFLYRVVMPDLEQILVSQTPDLLKKAAGTLVQLRKDPALEGLASRTIPINIDTSIALWQGDYQLWLSLIHSPCYQYLSSIHSYVRSQTMEANKLERQGLREKAKGYDARKAEAAKKLIADAISLGCPEVINIFGSDRNLTAFGVVFFWSDRQSSLSNSSHIPIRFIEDDIADLARALDLQRKKLIAKGIDMPLFEQESQYESRRQRIKREEKEKRLAEDDDE